MTFNSKTGNFAVSDDHGQIFNFDMSSNKYQIIRLAGTSPVTCMEFLHSKLNYIAVAYEAGNLIVIDAVARKSVASLHATGNKPIRLLRCHPRHSMLLGYSEGVSYNDQNNLVKSYTLDIFDLKNSCVLRTMDLKESLVDVKFLDSEGKYFGVLFEKRGVVVYRSRDCSVALTCPFPDSERMPAWTALCAFTFNGKAIKSPFNDETGEWENLDEDDGVEPQLRFLTAGDNSMIYMWESPNVYEMNIAEKHNFQSCAIVGAVVDLPVNMQTAAFMEVLGDAASNGNLCRLVVTSTTGTTAVIDAQGVAGEASGTVGIWTMVSDLAKMPAAARKITGIDMSNASTEKQGTRLGGILSGSGYIFGLTSHDGVIRVIDSDLSMGYGHHAGLILMSREPHADLLRVRKYMYMHTRICMCILCAPLSLSFFLSFFLFLSFSLSHTPTNPTLHHYHHYH